MNSPPFRFEAKYALDPVTYRRVRAALAPAFRLDPYSRRAPRGRYLVRSLYFDTDDYQAYFEKVTGETTRAKLRLRSYSASAHETNFVNVEIKRRFGVLLQKEGARVGVKEYREFMEGFFWKTPEEPVLEKFAYQVRCHNLKPRTLVEYFREAYQSRSDRRVRISFDHDIRYANEMELFPPKDRFRSEPRQIVILEIKVPKDDIELVNRLVRSFDLKAVPNSKYVSAIEETQHALLYR